MTAFGGGGLGILGDLHQRLDRRGVGGEPREGVTEFDLGRVEATVSVLERLGLGAEVAGDGGELRGGDLAVVLLLAHVVCVGEETRRGATRVAACPRSSPTL